MTQAQYAEFVSKQGIASPITGSTAKLPAGKGTAPYPQRRLGRRERVLQAGQASACRPKPNGRKRRARRAGRPGLPWGDKITPADARFNTPEGPGAGGIVQAECFRALRHGRAVSSEWCSDWFDRTYYETSPEKNPNGPEAGKYRIVRGGVMVRRTATSDGVLP